LPTSIRNGANLSTENSLLELVAILKTFELDLGSPGMRGSKRGKGCMEKEMREYERKVHLGQPPASGGDVLSQIVCPIHIGLVHMVLDRL